MLQLGTAGLLLGILVLPSDSSLLKDATASNNAVHPSSTCPFHHAFHCGTGKNCVAPEKVRDGSRDCPDGSDESPDINVCDYAPYFPDYRCSVYANCINLTDGYSCKCRSGYIGPGEFCQPVPLNLQRHFTNTPPLLIQTMRESTRSRTDAIDQNNRFHQSPPYSSILNATTSSARGTTLPPGQRSPVNVRETRMESGTRPTENVPVPVTSTVGITLPKNQSITCPNGSLIINEQAKVWCLRIRDGRLLLPEDQAATLQNPTSNVSTAINGVSSTPPTTASTETVTLEGAIYGFSSVSPVPKIEVKPVSVALGDNGPGEIITAVKIWNATGSAPTAYRMTMNSSLPASCLDGTGKKYLCAEQNECVTPDKLLDGKEDCQDGSDEIPEFIDECAFGKEWPRYRCGNFATCTDTTVGYMCTCYAGYYWNETVCVTVPATSPNDGIQTSTVYPLGALMSSLAALRPLGQPTQEAGSSDGNRYPNTVSFVTNAKSPSWSIFSSMNVTNTTLADDAVRYGIPVCPGPSCPVSSQMITGGPTGGARDDGLILDIGRLNESGRRPLPTFAPFLPTVQGYGSSINMSSLPDSPPSMVPSPALPALEFTPEPAASTVHLSAYQGGIPVEEGTTPQSLRTIMDRVFGGVTVGPIAQSSTTAGLRNVSTDARNLSTTTTSTTPRSTTSSSGVINNEWAAALEALRLRLSSPATTSVSPPSTTSQTSVSSTRSVPLTSTQGIRNVTMISVASNPVLLDQTEQLTQQTGRSTTTTPQPRVLTTAASISNNRTGRLTNGSLMANSGVFNRSTILGELVDGNEQTASQSDRNSSASGTRNLTLALPSLDSLGTTRSANASGPFSNLFYAGLVIDATTNSTTMASVGNTGRSNVFYAGMIPDYNVSRETNLTSLNRTSSDVRDPSGRGGSDQELALNDFVGRNASSGVLNNSGVSVTNGPFAQSSSTGNAVTFPSTANLSSANTETNRGEGGPARLVLPSSPLPRSDDDQTTSTASTVQRTTANLIQSANTSLPQNSSNTAVLATTPASRSPATSTVPVTSTANPLPALNRLWNLPTSAPVQDSLNFLRTTSPDRSLENEFDCFGDLFRRSLQNLQSQRKSCADCRGPGETCALSADRCDCVTGTSRVGSGQCAPSAQFQLSITFSSLCGRPLEFQPYLNDVASSGSQQLAVVICDQLSQLIRRTSLADIYDASSCKPASFAAGSVVSNLLLSFSVKNGSDPQTIPFDIVQQLSALLSSGNGSLNGLRSLGVKPASDANANSRTYQLSVTDIDECAAGRSPCDPNADCTNSVGQFTCTCREGYRNSDPVVPGRVCQLSNSTNGNATVEICPADYYRFATLCLWQTYFILLMVAFALLGLIVLIILGCIIVACYRCCNKKERELDPPQVALMRAAARSPRAAESVNATTFQVLKSSATGTMDPSTLHPSSAAAPPAQPDIEGGKRSNSKTKLLDQGSGSTKPTDKVETWEEVEVPKFPQREETNNVQSAAAKSQTALSNKLDELTPASATDPSVDLKKDSIGSAGNLARSEYSVATDASTKASVKGIASARSVAKKYHLEAQNSIRKASSETRDWPAMARNESLQRDDSGLDVNTLPEHSFDRDPVYGLASPVPGVDTNFDDKELMQMGIGLRDSFDDVVDQSNRFFPIPSSENEFDKETDLTKDGVVKPPHNLSQSTNDILKTEPNNSYNKEPTYPIAATGIPDDVSVVGQASPVKVEELENEADADAEDEVDEDDHLSLKSTDEEELKNLRGSLTSLKSLKKTGSHDSVIDQIVEDQPVFYSPSEDEEEDALHKRSSAMRNEVLEETKNSLMEALETPERKPSAVQREIAVREFGALGDRDSFDDLIDNTRAFFSRASTVDSFQLSGKGGEEETDSGPASRKPSRDRLGSELNTQNAAESTTPRKRSLLKKRSAFYSRDSMNRIIEKGDEGSVDQDADKPAAVEVQGSDGPILLKSEVSPVVEEDSTKPKEIGLDDSDIDAFFSTSHVPAIEPSQNDDDKNQDLKEDFDAKRTAEQAEVNLDGGEEPRPGSAVEVINEQSDQAENDAMENDPQNKSASPIQDAMEDQFFEPMSSPFEMQVQDAAGNQAPIPRDSDSGVYVDVNSYFARNRNPASSQDDLNVFEGQEERRQGSASSYQRTSQSDDEEEVIRRYSKAYEAKVKKSKRIRHNYEMGPPESRHVYYSSRPKKMPPSKGDLASYDTTWWRIRR